MTETRSEDEVGSPVDLLGDSRLIAVWLVTFTGIFGVQAVPVALPGISATLGVSDADIGLVMTAFFLPSAAAMFFVGTLADIYGRRTIVLPALFVFGVAGTAVAFVDSFAVLLGLRVLQGAAFPALTPLSTALIGDFYGGTAGTTAQGIRSSVNGIASVISPVLAGVLAGIAWQYPFLLSALAFPALVVVYVYLPETAGGDRETGPIATARSHVESIVVELADTNLRLLAVGAFAEFFVKVSVLTFVPLFAVRRLGATSFVVGLLVSVVGFARIVAAPLAGRVVDRLSRRWAIVAVHAGIAGSVLLIPFSPGVIPLAVLIGTYSVSEALFNPILNDAVVKLATDEHRAGVSNSINMFKDAANAASPVLFGLVLTAGGFVAVFALLAASSVLYAVVIALRFDPR